MMPSRAYLVNADYMLNLMKRAIMMPSQPYLVNGIRLHVMLSGSDIET
jgi:hypothetical protein